MRVADYIISFVQEKMNVDTIFMISGGGIMHLMDAIACNKRIKYVCSHNEQATTMEADGYAKMKMDFGVALVTTGPGATNAITGVVGAWQDSVPLMVISGQSKIQQTIYTTRLKDLRQFGVQEVHIIPLIETVTKYSVLVDEPEKIRYHLEKAIFLAKHGRPGPVWLDIPLNIQGAIIQSEKLVGFNPETEGYIHAVDLDNIDCKIQMILNYIQKAQRPMFLAGQGVRIAAAVESLNKLLEQVNIPVATPRLGIDIMQSDHCLYVGRPGIKGDRAANFAVQNSDLIIGIGTRLSINLTGHEYDKFARDAKVIVVDIDVVEHKKPTIKIDDFIKCDAKIFIDRLYQLAKIKGVHKNDDWPKTCRSWKDKYPVVLEEYRKQFEPVNTYYFTEVLSAVMDDDDVCIIDSGSSSYVVSQAISIKKGQRYIASGGLGSMGYAVPAAIGASVANDNKRVICITGDGSFHMNVQELQTIAHYQLPVKIFVFNNNGYASIKTTQTNYFEKRYVGVDQQSGVTLPDVLKIAELYEIKGVRIEDIDCIKQKIQEVLRYPGPCICDVLCSPNQLIIPTVYSMKKEDGRMISKPLEDMYPFLDRDEFEKEMIIAPLDE